MFWGKKEPKDKSPIYRGSIEDYHHYLGQTFEDGKGALRTVVGVLWGYAGEERGRPVYDVVFAVGEPWMYVADGFLKQNKPYKK